MIARVFITALAFGIVAGLALLARPAPTECERAVSTFERTGTLTSALWVDAACTPEPYPVPETVEDPAMVEFAASVGEQTCWSYGPTQIRCATDSILTDYEVP